MSENQYILQGGRQGFDLLGLTRLDCPDGYSEFRKENGELLAIVKTIFVHPKRPEGPQGRPPVRSNAPERRVSEDTWQK